MVETSDKFSQADKYYDDGYKLPQMVINNGVKEYYLIKGQYTLRIDEDIWKYIKKKKGEL
jgi:hypothetical protein